MEITVGNTKIILVCGDITEQETDAIVNAANSSLMGGGGVDGAIHKKGGPDILKECKIIRRKYPGGLPAGKAVITTGGELKARKVIHTVGPVWHGGNNKEPQVLTESYQNSLKIAIENGIKTVSFPSISTGAYGYPVEKASKVAINAVVDFLKKHTGLEEVRFVLHSVSDLEIYKRLWQRQINEIRKEVYG